MAVGQAVDDKKQEEFLQMQTFDRTFDRELGAGLGRSFHHEVAPPVPSMPIMWAESRVSGKRDAITLAPFC